MKKMYEITKMLSICGALDFFGTRKEVKELPNIIEDDETITYATSGFLNGSTWLIVSTNKRVIFLDKGMFFGLKQIEIPLDKINSIGHTKGLVLGSIEIWDGASKMEITQVNKKTLLPFVNAVNKSRQENKLAQRQTVQTQTLSGADEILKYKSLLDSGIITQEEFNKKKKDILGI